MFCVAGAVVEPLNLSKKETLVRESNEKLMERPILSDVKNIILQSEPTSLKGT